MHKTQARGSISGARCTKIVTKRTARQGRREGTNTAAPGPVKAGDTLTAGTTAAKATTLSIPAAPEPAAPIMAKAGGTLKATAIETPAAGRTKIANRETTRGKAPGGIHPGICRSIRRRIFPA